ncbi:MAG: transposase [Elusimicrobiota bacterium]
MPRRARFTFEDATYHIMSRGNNRQPVFLDDEDYKKFLELLLFYKKKNALKIYHYVLMSNHYHLILQAKGGFTLASAMKGLNLSYAKHYRRKYGGVGYLWQGRFKSFVIQNGRYILECGRYMELNPVRAGMVDSCEKYRWTSYRFYAFGEKNKIADENPEYLGFAESIRKRQAKYKEFVVAGLKEKRRLDRYFRGKAYGDKNFVKMLSDSRGLKQLWSHSGRPKNRSGKTGKM